MSGKRDRKEILADADKALKKAREDGDTEKVRQIVDSLPVLGAWHRRDQ